MLKVFTILSVASIFGGMLGYFMTDKMMDAIWEYYLRVNVSTLAICIGVLFLVATLTVGYKTITTALMNPVNTLRDE